MKRILLWVLIITGVLVYFLIGLYYGRDLLAHFGIGVNIAKTIIEMLRSIIETIAIIIAGLWTYERFIKSREEYPYIKIQHRIQHYDLGNLYTYLSVFITVTNEGKEKLDLSSGVILVRKILPLSDRLRSLIAISNYTDIEQGKNTNKSDDEYKMLFTDETQRVGWDTLGRRLWEKNLRGKMHELEPMQTRDIQFDFLFNEKVEVLAVISYFDFDKAHWEHTTIHSLEETR